MATADPRPREHRSPTTLFEAATPLGVFYIPVPGTCHWVIITRDDLMKKLNH